MPKAPEGNLRSLFHVRRSFAYKPLDAPAGGRGVLYAARRQVATNSPRWLNAWGSNSTTPASGRERDTRSERTMEQERIVSPWNTGLGNATLLMPRLAMVVPSVVSPTVMPIISPSVKIELTMR